MTLCYRVLLFVIRVHLEYSSLPCLCHLAPYLFINYNPWSSEDIFRYFQSFWMLLVIDNLGVERTRSSHQCFLFLWLGFSAQMTREYQRQVSGASVPLRTVSGACTVLSALLNKCCCSISRVIFNRKGENNMCGYGCHSYKTLHVKMSSLRICILSTTRFLTFKAAICSDYPF